MKKRILCLIVSVVFTFGAVLTGCSNGNQKESSSDNSSKEPVYGGSVVVGIQQDIDGLDPHKAVAAGTKEILFNIFEGLVKPDENGNLVNAIAESYTVSSDNTVYTFKLRKGVKFHNGKDVTAEDVKYSLERAGGLLDGKALISALKKISKVNIVDSETVDVVLAAPDTEIIYNLTAAILPKPEDDKECEYTIGTGPFKFVSYEPQGSVVVEKNPYYWQSGVPYLDKVTFKIVASTDAAMLELKAGTIDIYPYLTDSQAAELSGTFNVAYDAANVIQALFLNNKVAPFDNVKVRQAMNYAIDRNAINAFVSGNRASIIACPMLPGLKDYYEDCTGMYPYNVEKAKELLKEAGYPDGFEMTITVPSNYSFHMQTAEVIVEQLAKAGIKAVIKPVEWETWLEKAYTGREYQSTICGITSDLSPNYVLNRYESTSSKNFTNFANTEYDEVYKKTAATTNRDEKVSGYKKLQNILAQDANSVYIQVTPLIIALNKNIGGYKFYPVYVQDMSCVFLTK